jgi:hypothetical protein
MELPRNGRRRHHPDRMTANSWRSRTSRPDPERSGSPHAGDADSPSRPDAANSMKWQLAIIAATVLAVAGASRRLTGKPITPAMVFVLVGVLVGPS